MPEIEITCQYVNKPKEGKKLGSIKSSEGTYYYVDPTMLSRFGVGEVCTIEFDVSDDGKWKRIKRKISTSAAAPAPTFRSETSPKDSKQIFVTALLKEMVSGDDNQASVIAKGNMLKDAYDTLFGTAAKQTTENQMRDKIPDEF